MRLIAHNDGRELRGSERQLLYIVTGLAARGHEVLVSCRAGGALARELHVAGIETTAIRPRGDLAIGSALAFRRLLADRRPDAVLLTSWKRLFTASWMATGAGVPRVVARLGIAWAMPQRWRSAWKIRRALTRHVDLVVVNSEAVSEAGLARDPWLEPGRVRVIRSGVALAPGNATTVRRELGIGDAVRLVTSVAALTRLKGLDVLLRATPSLPQDVHVVIAGDGPDLQRLQRIAADLGIAARVHWLGDRSDIPDILAASAAFVLPTRLDSIPNALLEAMAAGIPVVTTKGNGAEEVLAARAGRPAAGWIVTPDDPAGLAAATREALVGGSDARKEALWRADHWFGVDRMVSEYEAALFGNL